MKNWRRIAVALAIIILAVVALIIYSPSNLSDSRCGPYRNDKIVAIDSSKIKAEVARSDDEKAKGLGNRPCIEANQAMLFVFDEPGRYPFWMKDMRFPIDIIWIGADQKVVKLVMDVSPSTYPNTIVPEQPAQYVLELPANRSKTLNITVGTPINF